MDLLVIALTIAIMLICYIIIDKLDMKISLNYRENNFFNNTKPIVLIYGDEKTYKQAMEEEIECRMLDSYEYPEDILPVALMILSENDENNMRLCKSARMKDEGLNIIVKCNDEISRQQYEKNGANYVLQPNETAIDFMKRLWKK
jgi:Trk K+ transport system NAD-binding subunit